ncbi:MAG: trypsin-like peptidase domain-containing protein [Bacilli bacterium]|nr:trypsin-like peptidase domain-containing protein [Bacilli bacterium]
MKKVIIGIVTLVLLLAMSVSYNPQKDLINQLRDNYQYEPLSVELNDFSSQYQQNITSTVLILNCNYKGGNIIVDSTGSGFVYKERQNPFNRTNGYYIITNYHVVSGASKVFVVTHTGEIVEASVVGVGNNYQDIAVISIPYTEGLSVAKTNSDELKVGEEVYAIGTPSSINLFSTITKGVVSNNSRVIYDYEGEDLMYQSHAIQIDVAINPGNSGGPLFNSQGEVVGVNTFKIAKDANGEAVSGINFALPIYDMKIVADIIIETGYFKPITFGKNNIYENVSDLTIKERSDLKIDDSILDGVIVTHSNNDYLPKNFIIKKIENTEINDTFNLRRFFLDCSLSNTRSVIVEGYNLLSNQYQSIKVFLV